MCSSNCVFRELTKVESSDHEGNDTHVSFKTYVVRENTAVCAIIVFHGVFSVDTFPHSLHIDNWDTRGFLFRSTTSLINTIFSRRPLSLSTYLLAQGRSATAPRLLVGLRQSSVACAVSFAGCIICNFHSVFTVGKPNGRNENSCNVHALGDGLLTDFHCEFTADALFAQSGLRNSFDHSGFFVAEEILEPLEQLWEFPKPGRNLNTSKFRLHVRRTEHGVAGTLCVF